MLRKARVLAFVALALGMASLAFAATEVRMSGDVKISGQYWSKYNYTGWNNTGTQTYDPFTIWQRVRLRADFIVNESLKFRWASRVNWKAWGNDTYTVDNPAVSIETYNAYLQFMWPNTDIEFTIGMQEIGLPLSNPFWSDNPIVGGTRGTAALVNVPVVKDKLTVLAGFYRFLDSNKDFDTTTQQVPDEFDSYFLGLPITLEGFKATPWAMIGVAGSAANYNAAGIRQNMISYGWNLAPTGWKNGQNMYIWAGTTLDVTALDNFRFSADLLYGSGAMSDRSKNNRQGYHLSAVAEYLGLDMLTPQVAFWYSSGEDSGVRNGSERMPTVVGSWGPNASILFDCGQIFTTKQRMNQSTTGNWGLAFVLDKISFVKNLEHRIGFNYTQGTNSPRALRMGNALWGNGQFFVIGHDLATTEHVFAINFDHKYVIMHGLNLVAELGWAHGEFDKSIWGRRFVNAAQNGDAFKAIVGLEYKF